MKIVAAMSGGVDSAVAAILLHRQGHEVLGVTLSLREPEAEGEAMTCTSASHAIDARLAAEAGGIEFAVLEMRECFQREVIEPFVAAYRGGETPNPCIGCNSLVKLGPLLEWAKRRGYDKVATGHYARARIDPASEQWQLLRGKNPRKDQSYYLSGLSQDQLAHLVLPLGEFEDKAQTREMARQWGLPVSEKPDSQDVCLVGGKDYRGFLERRLGKEGLGGPGPILDTRGQTMGRHQGVYRYTVGQRRGLGISHPRPLYVVAIRPETNTVVVGEDNDTFESGLICDSINWIGFRPPGAPGEPFRAEIQIRYQHSAAPATIHLTGSDSAEARFDQPQRAVAPGQAAVFYRGEIVLGAGRIRRRELLKSEG